MGSIFTVNCAEQKGNQLLTNNIDLLLTVFRQVKAQHPFVIDAIVVLPEHLHCIWTLPTGDADYNWTMVTDEIMGYQE